MAIRCPVTGCMQENPVPVESCQGCGADLRAYAAALKLADLHFNLGLAAAGEHNYERAKHELGACLSLRHKDEEAMLVLGKVYWAAGEKRNARRIWKELLATGERDIKRQAEQCIAVTKGKRRRETLAVRGPKSARRRRRTQT